MSRATRALPTETKSAAIRPAAPARKMKGAHLVALAILATLVPLAAFRGFNPLSIPPYSDFWDYLQLGQQVLEGHFTSLFTYPIFLKYSGASGEFPMLWRQPLQPVLVAITMLISRQGLWAPIILQVAGYLLAILGTYRLGLEFVEAQWALFAAVLVALSPHVLGLAEPGIATTVYTAALTFGFLIAVRATSRKRAFLAGLYFGALVLLRAETLILFPAIVWMLWAGDPGDRENRIWHFLAAGFVVTLPWTLRNWFVTGRPFSSTSSLLFTDTRSFPGWTSSRRLDMLDQSALLWAFAHPGDVVIKTLKNGYHFLFQALLMPIPALAPFVWAGLGRVTRIGRESAFCAALLIGLVLFVVILSPLEYAARFLHPFIPAVAVVGTIVLARIREDLGDGSVVSLSRRPILPVALAVLVLAGLELIGALVTVRRTTMGASAGLAPDRETWEEVRLAAGSTPSVQPPPAATPGFWALADYPSYYAWFTDARFVWMPVLEDIPKIEHDPDGLRTVILLRDRGSSGPDPTGIPATSALVDTLTKRGYIAENIGPFVVLNAKSYSNDSQSTGSRR